MFLALKTEGAVRDDATKFTIRLALPVTVIVAGFGLWTQLAYGKDWTWLVLGIAVVAQLGAVMLVWSRGGGDGWAFAATATVIASVVVLIFGCLYPNLIPSTLDPAWSLTIHNASSTPYTLTIMSWAAVLVTPPGHRLPGLDLLGVPAAHLADRIPPDPAGLSPRLP